MLIPDASHPRDTLRRIGLWFVCLPMAVALFSLLFTVLFNRAAFTFSIVPIFQPTMMFALPVWCLYLPWVIALKDAEGRRIWTIPRAHRMRCLMCRTSVSVARPAAWGILM